LLVVGCWEIHQLATINHQLSSKDGLNNILTGIEPGEISDFRFLISDFKSEIINLLSTFLNLNFNELGYSKIEKVVLYYFFFL
jgi:hypothetical protein